MNLQDVIECAQRGKKEAFRQLFESVENKALQTSYYLCGDRGIAEDILQETYMRCFIDIKKLRLCFNLVLIIEYYLINEL